MTTGLAPGKIQVLPPDVIGRIAAGEVVERPAAVVKELLDNSLDAQSRCIVVEVTQGGLGKIRVADDGEGMAREDAVLAFERHATSKLRSDQDLDGLTTLGFRGEALPSIAAVAKVSLVTMPPGRTVGTRVQVHGGAVASVQDAAGAPGTQIEIEDLFYNTPARKKFLKSVTTEYSHILQAVQRAALAWPHVQFRLVHNGQDVLQCPAASSGRDRLLQLYRGVFAEHGIAISRVRPGLRVEGIVISPLHVRATRSPQELFVNRRAVKNPTIAHAVADAYGPHLAKGRYPQFVLFLDLDPARVDVNVHPTKREVRFADQEYVHQTVRQAVREALGTTGAPSPLVEQGSAAIARVVGEALDYRRPSESAAVWVSESEGRATAPFPTQASQLTIEAPSTDVVIGGSQVSGASVDVVPLGQIGRTFLLAQVGTELQVIDQHTAHERVLFQRLWRSWESRSIQAQTLLAPQPLELPPHQRALLDPHLETLERVGLTIERFGSGAFLLRTVPVLLGTTDGGALVQRLLEDVDEWHTHSSLERAMHLVIATMACHSAVRAGRQMALAEIDRLVRDWADEGMIMTCPHGRRTALRLPLEELSRMFGRI